MYEENRDYYQNGQSGMNDQNSMNSEGIQNAQGNQASAYTPNWQFGGQGGQSFNQQTGAAQGAAAQQTGTAAQQTGTAQGAAAQQPGAAQGAAAQQPGSWQSQQNGNGQNQQAGGWQSGADRNQQSGAWQNAGQQNNAGQGYYSTWQDDRRQSQQGSTWQDGRQQAGGWQNAGRANTWQSADQYQDKGNAKKRARKEKKKKTSGGFGAGKAVAIALCCSLLGGVIGAGGVLFGGRYLGLGSGNGADGGTVILQGQRPVSPISVANIDTSKEMTEAEVYAMNVNSTVGITTSITTNYWGIQSTSAASGSGFILTEDGYIITNQHVIDSSNTITVTTFDGTAYDAELVGYDTSNDIAVLKIDATGLTPVILGDSDSVNVGDKVVAIGNPLGELTFSLVGGFISALDRSVTFSSGATMDLMQVSCAINAGNSGGPLFNMYGEVIGITNAKYSNNGDASEASIENIGFAIPVSHVRSIIESIITKGYITKPYIGVTITNVSSDLQAYGVPQGAMVKEVTEDGPADKAGIQANDIITQIDDTEIADSSGLVDYVGKCAEGDKIVLKVYRQGETVEITVTVEETRKSALEEEEQNQNQQQQQQQQPNGGYSFPWNFFGF